MSRALIGLTAGFALLLASTAAAANDYTGLWKENCTDAYGLQIKPHEGRYTVTFCDADGCGAPDLSSTTRIEGDEEYEVLAPDKIRLKFQAPRAPVYTRCTTDPDPTATAAAAERRRVSALHAAYFAVAILLFLYARKRPATQRRGIRTGIAAFLFTPTVSGSWPMVTPTFASIALVLSLARVAQAPRDLPIHLTASVVPMLAVWWFSFAVGSGSYLLSALQYTSYLAIGVYYYVTFVFYFTIASSFGLFAIVLFTLPVCLGGFASGLSLLLPRAAALLGGMLAGLLLMYTITLILTADPMASLLGTLPAAIGVYVSVVTFLRKPPSPWSHAPPAFQIALGLLIVFPVVVGISSLWRFFAWCCW